MKKLIEQWISEGKSDLEVAGLVLANEESKSMDEKSIADAITEAKKADGIMSALKARAKAEQDANALAESVSLNEKRIETAIDEKLKTIGIDFAKYKAPTELKRFDHRTGKIESVRITEEYGAMNVMLKSFSERDFKEAKAISNRIDIANDIRDSTLQGLVKATPTVSDFTTRGGFAIPTEVSDQIMQVLYAQSVMYSRVNKDNVIFESKVYPLMYGINVGYIASESTGVTEKNPVFINPTVTMERIGGYSAISNTLIQRKGADLVAAFVAAYGGAFAEFLDLHICCGNVTGNSDLIDGIVFDTNTNLPTPIALSSLTMSALKDIKNALSAKASLASSVFVANRKVTDAIGLMENTGGNYVFPGYAEGRGVSPFGIPLVTNAQIPSTLDVGGDNRTSGTDDVLILADLSKMVVGVSGDTRIDSSEHFLFGDDLLTLRAVKMFGQKVLSSTSTGGIVAVAQELTN
jgi:HK97 family phage major capsid protein